MILPFWAFIGIAVIVGIGLLKLALEHFDGSNRLIAIFLGLYVAGCILLYRTLPVAYIIKGTTENSVTKGFVLFSIEGHDVGFGEVYVRNNTVNNLIVYSVYYSSRSTSQSQELKYEKISPLSSKKLKHKIDYFFYDAPEEITTDDHSTVVEKWCIDLANKVNLGELEE